MKEDILVGFFSDKKFKQGAEMKKYGLVLGLVLVSFIVLITQAEAKTAVTITVEAGPALTEGNLTTVDLIVPERPSEALPLNIGDKVFFETLEPLLEGEGTITNIYDTEDSAIKEAVILDCVVHE